MCVQIYNSYIDIVRDIIFNIYICLSSPEDIFNLFLEKEEVGERGRERERERETSVGCLLVCAFTWNPTCNLGMCPDQESNPGLFGLWDDAPTN